MVILTLQKRLESKRFILPGTRPRNYLGVAMAIWRYLGGTLLGPKLKIYVEIIHSEQF